ncbi:cNMP_binding domain-containing protein [Cephalotus follicularis]|uniref:cNMP_binding domain-containing protein n=1 Tax=Cephalotus follicularis TaxID=3775 RepID=A0A1Q3C709_CEPFO|nr:cNMP_binding domain-containing protein [Cephalotus follicularis]
MKILGLNPALKRVQADPVVEELPIVLRDGVVQANKTKKHGEQIIPEAGSNKTFIKRGKSLKAKVLHRVYSEDYDKLIKLQILDPRGHAIRRWSKIFLATAMVSLFVDPLFLYLPIVRGDVCIDVSLNYQTIITTIRSLADVFYVIQIVVRIRTAYVVPSSRVFGRGELEIDSSKIASRYLRNGFWIDLLVALPLPQVLVWVIIPNVKGWLVTATKQTMWMILLFQYFPRLALVFPITSQIVETTGVLTETAWAGAALNLINYMLASHVSGACFYLLTAQRQEACWNYVCNLEKPNCTPEFFNCRMIQAPGRADWFQSSNVTTLCDPTGGVYQFGIFSAAATEIVTSVAFMNKYLYCYWWGLQTLSSVAQNLITSTYVEETVFTIIVATLGLVLFALLIGNMQRYLQSTTMRLEQWRIKRTDLEQWMRHRQLPQELRQSVRKYDYYRWLATRGVDEESLLQGLPMDLRRQIKRHLCYDLLRRVPLINEMDGTMLDAICERLKPALCTEGMYLVREGDPVNQMFFIIRGHLDSYTTGGGRIGFFNSCQIGPGDFCGEELLTWTLDTRPGVTLPSSTCSVKALSEVEAFALIAEDLKFVASQFKKLHSAKLKHIVRLHSHHWRTWAACFIQVAWRRHKKLKKAAQLSAHEPGTPRPGSFWDKFAESLVASSRGGASFRKHESDSTIDNSLIKPDEPDF